MKWVALFAPAGRRRGGSPTDAARRHARQGKTNHGDTVRHGRQTQRSRRLGAPQGREGVYDVPVLPSDLGAALADEAGVGRLGLCSSCVYYPDDLNAHQLFVNDPSSLDELVDPRGAADVPQEVAESP